MSVGKNKEGDEDMEKDMYYIDSKLKKWEQMYAQNHAITMNFLLEEIPDGKSEKLTAEQVVLIQSQTIDKMNVLFKDFYKDFHSFLEKSGAGKIHPNDDVGKMMDVVLQDE